MKKTLCTTLLALLLSAVFLAAGCTSAPAENPSATASPVPAATAAPDLVQPVEIPEFSIPMETIATLNSMQPVYDSLMRAMRDLPAEWSHFSANDPDFFWNTLYYLCANFGEMDSRNTLSGATLLVPYAVMEEYAAACFFDYIALLPLSEDNYGIVIDEAKQAYAVSMSDKGDSYVEAVNYEYGANDVYSVTVAWLTDGESYPDMLGAYKFMLAPNPYNQVHAISQPLYAYAVQFAYSDFTDIMLVKDTYERDGQKYAVLDPALLRFHSALDLDETGQPYGYEWTEVLNEQEENLEYIVSEFAEFELGELGWLFDDIVMEDAMEDAVAFFIKHAKREYEGAHLAFKMNTYDNVLYYASFLDEVYSVG